MFSAFVFVAAVWKLVQKVGALAFIPLGLIDNSVIPLPGSMDALTIVLAASRKELWWFYAIMATVGALLGGYLTYHLARKGGKEALDKKLKPNKAKRVHEIFGRYGFWSVFAGAIAPPPVPIVPFLATAGAMEYSRHKFLIALGTGRLVRFSLVAWLASRYGKHIFSFFAKYYKPALWTLVALAVAGGIAALIYYRRSKKRAKSAKRVPEHKAA